MTIQYYVASSLDGFIATADHSVDWLDALPAPSPSSYEAFYAEIDCVAMGSSTYEFILRHIAAGGSWPYDKPSWVFTTRELDRVPGADVRFVSGDVAHAREEMPKRVWVAGGGSLAGQFLDAGLLDEIIVTIASTTLGEGQPLLPKHVAPGRLRLTEVTHMGDGFVELRYQVALDKRKPIDG